MELIFLGTGAGMPSKLRNMSAVALDLQQERGSVWLFDCAEATQHQILHTNIRPRRIEAIFISHLHGDHFFGLPGLLGSRSNQDGITRLTVYGPKGIREYIEISLSVTKTELKYPLEVIEIKDGIIFEDETFMVQALQLEHGVPSFGFKITEKDSPGSLQVERLQELGISPGPTYKQIKNGEQVTLPNGQIINGKDFIGEAKRGRKLAYITDTRVTPNILKLVKGCDVLIHEATFSSLEQTNAFNYFHCTAKQAAEIAKEGKVHLLILTHISARYQKADQDDLLNEAQTIFPNTYLAHDFSKFPIERDLELISDDERGTICP